MYLSDLKNNLIFNAALKNSQFTEMLLILTQSKNEEIKLMKRILFFFYLKNACFLRIV